MSGLPSLTVLPEDQRFNGDNLLQWKIIMTSLLGSKGLLGYVDGKIPKPPKPASPPSTSTPADKATPPVAPTPVYSSTPTLDEWEFRDQLAKAQITLNCTDVTSLAVASDGTAKEVWDSILEEWGKSTDMRRSHAQDALNKTVFVEGSDIQEHIKVLRTRRAALDNLSSSPMSDETWRGVITRSIPPSAKWLPVIPTLYSLKTSAEVLSTLLNHDLVLGRDPAHKSSSGLSNTALTAKSTTGCANPNCKAKKRSSHTTDNCYWPGGGKEGQFPPNFGQRSKANTANSSSTMEHPEHFALSARFPDTPGRSGILIDDDPDDHPHMALISKGFDNFDNGRIPTFMDSGASDTMFVSKDVFTEYKPLDSRVGDSAKAKDGGFEIVGEGSVLQRYRVDGKDRDVTYTRALHTPTLNANLVSISALDKAGLTVTFGNGQGVARKPDGKVVLTGKGINGMYLLEPTSRPADVPKAMASSSLSQPTTLEQWHRRLTHCSPLTIKEMAAKNLVDGLTFKGDEGPRGKCEDCILGRQVRRPFDGQTVGDLRPLELVSFDLWGPSRVQSMGGKVYLMVIVDAGTSYKYGAYLPDKLDSTTIAAFETFCTTAESITGRKLSRLRTDGAFDTSAWKDYTGTHGLTHELSAPYSSSQNGLAERAIRTTIDDVRTLLKDSGLGHSYWAEAAAFSIYTRNLIPSRRHPDRIPLEAFSGRRQTVEHLRAFGIKCWAKIPTVHGVQVTGGSKLDQRSVECRLLGYTTGNGNYKVQDPSSRRVFVSRDVVFEEGTPHRTLTSEGETKDIPLFDADSLANPSAIITPDITINTPSITPAIITHDADAGKRRDADNTLNPVITDAPRRSTRPVIPSQARIQSSEYSQREAMGRTEGQEWATDHNKPTALWVTNPNHSKAFHAIDPFAIQADQEDFIACLTETKASHNIPKSYRHAMATDPERWTKAMEAEMENLKSKHTWELVKPPPDANIMESMWVYDIKWDGEGNRIKDKARLVGKGYTQRLGIDYNETWAAVTRLESVRMTAAIAAEHDLKLWRIDFVGAYLNSVTKEDIYMRQPEGFVEPGYEDYAAKLLHTIYGTMQGGHDWYETLSTSYDNLGYTTSRADPCVRFKKENGNYTLTDTYTDDTFGASNDDEEMRRRIDEIGKVWEIKDVGETEYFLGMRVQQDLALGTVRLTQRPYWEHVMSRFDLSHVPPRNTPLPAGLTLDTSMSPQTDSERKAMGDKPYRSILGNVMWGQLATRPDLSFAVSLLSRFQSNPGIEHWNALMHVIGYIKNTMDYGLTYTRGNGVSPYAFVDADYGGCKDTRRSTSGYVFMMAGGPVAWSSKRQATVALSTVEAEYVAMSRCAQQMVWMHSWLDEVDIAHELPGMIKGDNRGAIALTKNTKDHGKIKHIDIRHHYIRELVHSKAIAVEQVSSADNLADLFTKPLPRDQHHRLLAALNIT